MSDDEVVQNNSSPSDLSSPYSTHHSDHPGLVLISKPLNGNNYSIWKRAMTLALNSKNKIGFVNGTIIAPSMATRPNDYAKWSRCNDMVHSWIINTLSSEISDSVIYHTTAQEVWEDLRERFSQSNAPHIYEIYREIVRHEQKELSVSAYYTKLKSLWDELSSYSDAPNEILHERQKVVQFLVGLNDIYSAARGQILLMNPLPSVRLAYSLISQEEKQRSLSVKHVADDSVNSAAMMVRGNEGSRQQSNFRSQEKQHEFFNGGNRYEKDKRSPGMGRGRPHCTHCGKPGHWIQTCYELNGYPSERPKFNPGQKRNMNNKHVNNVTEGVSKEDQNLVAGAGLSEAQFQRLLSLLSDKMVARDPNKASSSCANAIISKPGSGYEEDDWFG